MLAIRRGPHGTEPAGRRRRPGPGRRHGGAVQVDPIRPKLKAPGTKRLKLKYDKLLSRFAFKFKLRHYTMTMDPTSAKLLQQVEDNKEELAKASVDENGEFNETAFVEELVDEAAAVDPDEEPEAGAYTRPLFGST